MTNRRVVVPICLVTLICWAHFDHYFFKSGIVPEGNSRGDLAAPPRPISTRRLLLTDLVARCRLPWLELGRYLCVQRLLPLFLSASQRFERRPRHPARPCLCWWPFPHRNGCLLLVCHCYNSEGTYVRRFSPLI